MTIPHADKYRTAKAYSSNTNRYFRSTRSAKATIDLALVSDIEKNPPRSPTCSWS